MDYTYAKVRSTIIEAICEATYTYDEEPARLDRLMDAVMSVAKKELDLAWASSEMWQTSYGEFRLAVAGALGVENDPAIDLIDTLLNRLSEKKSKPPFHKLNHPYIPTAICNDHTGSMHHDTRLNIWWNEEYGRH